MMSSAMRILLILSFLVLSAASAPAEVSFRQNDGSIDVLVDGKPFTTFYYGEKTTKPYFHPLHAADGVVVTRQFPMRDDIPGEAHDHPHHRGLWYSHGNVDGIDFWANETDQTGGMPKGRIVLKGIHKVGDGFIRGDFEWRGPDGEVMLTEKRTVWFRGEGKNRIVDFDVTLEAAVKPVKLSDTKEGTFAVRLAPSLRESRQDRSPGDGVIVNAEGQRGEKLTWGKASPWVDYSGPIGDKNYGVAILDHPENPKHPTFWHVRAYGLFAANPFGEHDFFRDKTRDGSITIAPGKSIRFRYRVVIHPGNAEMAGVAGLYKSWAGR